MSTQEWQEPQIEVESQVKYVASESKPEESSYYFAYRISIKNKGNVPAQLMSRHWVITDMFGRTEEVRGPGVIGLQPKIQPGQNFEYESACPLPTSTGSMKGTYFMALDNGSTFTVEIPEFFLVAPQALN